MAAVSLDPFQDIVGVGWNSPFVLIHYTAHPDLLTGSNLDSPADGIRLEMISPIASPPLKANLNNQSENGFKDLLLSCPVAGAAVISGFEQVAFFTWFINIALIYRTFGQLIDDSGGEPPDFHLSFGGIDPHPSVASIPSLALIRWQVYKGRALPSMESFNADFTARVNAIAPAARTISNVMAAMTIPGAGLLAAEDEARDAVNPRSFWGAHYRFFWDFPNRGNRLQFPPFGAQPRLQTL